MSKRLCSVEGCNGIHKGLGYCQKHWQRFKKYGSADDSVLSRNTSKRLCPVPECSNIQKGLGFCKKHSYRLNKYGSAEAVVRQMRPRGMNRSEVVEYYISRADTTNFGCLETDLLSRDKGYTICSFNGQSNSKLHRLVLEEKIGRTLGRWEFACHHCDNPSCFNPDHLFVGSPKDNTQDAANKGRMMGGENNNKAKLTEEKVREIRNLKDQGLSSSKIAEKYDVGVMCIYKICKRKTWKHVK